MRVIITGGTGLIGRALAESLAADGHEVVLLSRSPGNVVGLPDGVQAVYWDTRSLAGWGDLVDGAGAVINLAGASVAGKGLLDVRWTPARRRAILQSRVLTGQAVVEAIRAAKQRPPVLIQSSAVGYYGTQTGDQRLDESAAAANDFLAQVCADWESSTAAVKRLGVRRAVIRTGVVMSTQGGALPRQMLPFRLFAGGPLGSGQQWFPWIHIVDEVRAIRFLIDKEEAEGVFNLSAPEPVTNADFSDALGRAMGRPSWLPVPSFAFNLAFGEAAAVLLEGQRAVPAHLLELGFEFEFTDPEVALHDLLATKR